MNRYLIIEDEPLNASRLKRMILEIEPESDVAGPLESITEVISHLRAHRDYDLIFADIRLNDGDVFQAFQQVMPQTFVVFTTAYDEYAMQAIKSHGIDYLLKPIDPDELEAAIDKAHLYRTNLHEVQAFADSVIRYKERLLVYKGSDMVSLPVCDILYFKTDGRKVQLMTASGELYAIPTPMQGLEQELDPVKFFRLNRQYLVNIRAIQRISTFFSGKLKVYLNQCHDEDIIVSRERSQSFRDWLNS